MSDNPIHRPIHHESAGAHVTGRAQYVDDIPVPADTLHIAPVLSPVAHGRLVGVDGSQALALEGVIRLVTAADIPGVNDVSPIAGDDPLLAVDELIYEGQQVAVIVATSRALALRAASLVEVKFEALPAIISLDQAIAENTLIQAPYRMSKGDAETAIETAPSRISGSFTVGGQDHFYLEGQAPWRSPQTTAPSP